MLRKELPTQVDGTGLILAIDRGYKDAMGYLAERMFDWISTQQRGRDFIFAWGIEPRKLGTRISIPGVILTQVYSVIILSRKWRGCPLLCRAGNKKRINCFNGNCNGLEGWDWQCDIDIYDSS